MAHGQLTASAPCRIDTGGTWDIKALALSHEGIRPTTVNAALSLRTFVTLSSYEDGWVKISSKGFSRSQAFLWDQLPFDSAFGTFFAAISYFGFHGLEVYINSQSPLKSALGGSSTALVALIKALSKVSVGLGRKELSKKDILHLAFHLEDSIVGGNCGIQDHAAAVYGGVHQWKWRYGHRTIPFESISLLNRKGQIELSKHLLVAYSGKSHISSRSNRTWIKDFLSGRTRVGWVRVNEIVHCFAQAIRDHNWNQATELLKEEMDLRKELTPEALIPITARLVSQAEHVGCGARFAGAGAGGSVWALGEMKNIQQVRKTWEDTLTSVKGAKILHCDIDPTGVK